VNIAIEAHFFLFLKGPKINNRIPTDRLNRRAETALIDVKNTESNAGLYSLSSADVLPMFCSITGIRLPLLAIGNISPANNSITAQTRVKIPMDNFFLIVIGCGIGKV